MKVAHFEYKCRRCGEIDRSSCCGEALARSCIVAMVIDEKVDLKIGMQPQLLSIHYCKDEGEGISDCIGYELKDE